MVHKLKVCLGDFIDLKDSVSQLWKRTESNWSKHNEQFEYHYCYEELMQPLMEARYTYKKIGCKC